jgi:hypothetical protein
MRRGTLRRESGPCVGPRPSATSGQALREGDRKRRCARGPGEHEVRPYDGERFSRRGRAAGLDSEPRATKPRGAYAGPLTRPATAGENACRGPPTPLGGRLQILSGARARFLVAAKGCVARCGAQACAEEYPSPPGRGWLAAGAFTSRGEAGEGSVSRPIPHLPDSVLHLTHELAGGANTELCVCFPGAAA